MIYTLFKFKNGNPYIANTESEKARLLRKYKGKITKLGSNVYYIEN